MVLECLDLSEKAKRGLANLRRSITAIAREWLYDPPRNIPNHLCGLEILVDVLLDDLHCPDALLWVGVLDRLDVVVAEVLKRATVEELLEGFIGRKKHHDTLVLEGIREVVVVGVEDGTRSWRSIEEISWRQHGKKCLRMPCASAPVSLIPIMRRGFLFSFMSFLIIEITGCTLPLAIFGIDAAFSSFSRSFIKSFHLSFPMAFVHHPSLNFLKMSTSSEML